MVKTRETARATLDELEGNVSYWLDSVQTFLSLGPQAVATLERACELAEHSGTSVKSPLQCSCFSQGLGMADILVDLYLDYETLVAAILFPLYRYGDLSEERIEKEYSASIAGLVKGAKQMEAIQALRGQHKMTQTDRLRKMLLSMVQDVRIVLVKLAERTYVLRHIKSEDGTIKRQVALDVQEIYAPLANRLGVGQLKWEMEDLAFRYLEGETYREIAALLHERRVDREQYIQSAIRLLATALETSGVHAEVTGRVKHIYSIWRKMRLKGLGYEEIYDVRAVRVITEHVPDCYAALGCVHSMWKHIPHEFDDYIATPKPNGYQSIHTAVIGPEGKTIEVQIRTQEMHQEAELGVAAHWRYKEGVKHDASYETKIAWLRQLLDWQEEIADSDEVIEQFKAQVVEDRVYVFTPAGDVVDLQQGATPLDFAYHVHTEVGHRCRGAKINGMIVPLTYTLKTGERVEILTHKQGQPSRDWLSANLGYLKTSRARSKAQQWFKLQSRDENIQEGRAALEKEVSRMNLGAVNYEQLAKKMNFSTADDLFVMLGVGELRPFQVLQSLQQQDDALPAAPIIKPSVPVKKHSAAGSNVVVDGVDNLLIHLAGCCKPLPGDEIIGYVTLGRGISVHRKNCPNMTADEIASDRVVHAKWSNACDERYPVDIHVIASENESVSKNILQLFASENIALQAFHASQDKKVGCTHFHITLLVSELGLLSKLLDRIQQLKDITQVKRF